MLVEFPALHTLSSAVILRRKNSRRLKFEVWSCSSCTATLLSRQLKQQLEIAYLSNFIHAWRFGEYISVIWERFHRIGIEIPNKGLERGGRCPRLEGEPNTRFVLHHKLLALLHNAWKLRYFNSSRKATFWAGNIEYWYNTKCLTFLFSSFHGLWFCAWEGIFECIFILSS